MREYDPARDLYEVLGLSPEADEPEIRARIHELRQKTDSWVLQETAAVLLDLEQRTRYDAQRAGYRLRRIMRANFGVFAGRPGARSDR